METGRIVYYTIVWIRETGRIAALLVPRKMDTFTVLLRLTYRMKNVSITRKLAKRLQQIQPPENQQQ